MPRPITFDSTKLAALAKRMGGKHKLRSWQGKRQIYWTCHEGHTFRRSVSEVKRGDWCRRCASPKRLTLKKLQAYAKSKGGTCLSTSVDNAKSMILWKCKRGHRWTSSVAQTFSAKHWCRECSYKDNRLRRRGDFTPVLKQVRRKGGRLLSKRYVGRHTKYRFQCDKDHPVFNMSAANIINGSWCPVCARAKIGDQNRKYSIGMIRKVARSRGGDLISSKFHNVNEKFLWICRDDHRWSATAASVIAGSWCPTCRLRLNTRERLVRIVMEQITGLKLPSARPAWLMGLNFQTLQLDGFDAARKVAFEHHGKQHSHHVSFFHRNESALRDQRERDSLKRKLCRRNGVTLIEVPYLEAPTPEAAYNALVPRLKRARVPLRTFAFDPQAVQRLMNIGENADRLRELKKIVSKRGGRLVSEAYIDSLSPLEVICAKGHKFWPLAGGLRRGSWCPECSGQRKDLSYYDKVARMLGRGSECLATKYRGVSNHVRWRCGKRGHVFSSTAVNIVAGNKCPECRSTFRDLSYLKKLAKRFDGKCLDDGYVRSTHPVRWECGKGHRFKMSAARITKGGGCRVCYLKKLQKNRDVTYLKRLATGFGGESLEKHYIKSSYRARWLCKEGHTFRATANNVSRGHWCGECWRGRNRQSKLKIKKSAS